MGPILELLLELSAYRGATPVSFSRVNSMLACPLKWKLQYVDRIKAAPYADQESTDMGKFMHQVSELMLNSHKTTGTYRFDPRAYNDIWNAVAMAYPKSIVSKAGERMREGSESVTQRLFELINKYSFRASTEVRLGLNRSGKVIQGIPWRDALWVVIVDLHLVSPKYQGSLLVDYKSHAPSSEMLEKEKLQVDSYVLMDFLRDPNLKLVQSDISYFSTGETQTVGKYKQADVPELEGRVLNFLRSYQERLQASEYPHTQGVHCKWCGYRAFCPDPPEL